jgi:hypothetical protein
VYHLVQLNLLQKAHRAALTPQEKETQLMSEGEFWAAQQQGRKTIVDPAEIVPHCRKVLYRRFALGTL